VLLYLQKKIKDKDTNRDEDDAEGVAEIPREDDLEEIDQKDDGYIELVLRVLARMCDGQHKGLQVNLSRVHVDATLRD